MKELPLEQQLVNAIEKRDIATAVSLVEQGADLSTRSDPPYGLTLLELIIDKSFDKTADAEKLIGHFRKLKPKLTRACLVADRQKITPLHTLAYYKPNPIRDKIFQTLLALANAEDLNAYNNYGKTPLLEALEQENIQAASTLIQHKEVDISLAKKQAANCFNRFFRGVTPIAAITLIRSKKLFTTISARVDVCYTNLPFSYFSIDYADFNNPKLASVCSHRDDISEIEFSGGSVFHLAAAMGHLNWLKQLIVQLGMKLFVEHFSQDGFSVLLAASINVQVSIVEFLLDKSALDALDPNGFLTDADYIRCINASSSSNDSALSRLWTVGRDKDFRRLAPYFLSCPYFDLNKADMVGDSIAHILTKINSAELFELAVMRTDLDFNQQNASADSALRLLINSTDPMSLGLLQISLTTALLGKLQLKVNDHVKDRPQLKEKLVSAFEESWFGEADILSEVNVKDLAQVYVTGKEKIISIAYEKCQCTIELQIEGEVTAAQRQLFTDTAVKIIEGFENCSYSNLLEVNHPQMDLDLASILNARIIGHPDENDDATDYNLVFAKKIKYAGVELKIKNIQLHSEKVEASVVISREFLQGMVTESQSLYRSPHDPMIYTLVKRCNPKFEKNEQVRSLFREKLKIFLQLQGVDLTIPDSQFHSVYSYATDEVKASLNAYSPNVREDYLQPQELIANASLAVRLNIEQHPVERKDANKLYDDLNKKKGPLAVAQLRLFAGEFAAHSLGGKIRLCGAESPANRRLDSLVRLMEGEGVCAALYFDGEKLVISSNFGEGTTPNTRIESETKALINNVLEHFRKVSAKVVLTEQQSIDLLLQSCGSRIIKKHKVENAPTLKSLLSKIFYNLDKLNGVILHGENAEVALNEEKITQDLGLNDVELGIQSFKQVFLQLLRVVNDYAKFKSSLLTSDANKQLHAEIKVSIELGNYQILANPNRLHAEMRVLDFILQQLGNDELFGENLIKGNYYLAISKLPCTLCDAVFTGLQRFFDKFKITALSNRGTHAIPGYWSVPEFLISRPALLREFLGGKSSDAYQAFCQIPMDSNNHSAVVHIIQSVLSMKTKQIQRLGLLDKWTKKQQQAKLQADWSTSKASNPGEGYEVAPASLAFLPPAETGADEVSGQSLANGSYFFLPRVGQTANR